MENTEIGFDLVSDALMMSHWQQASKYMFDLGLNDEEDQVIWVYENEPEQLFGFSKWVSREFRNYKRDTNFEFYGTIKDVIKNTLNSIEIINRPYFDLIEKSINTLINTDDIAGTIYSEYLLKMVEKYLIEIYTKGNADAQQKITEFLNNPFGTFPEVMNIIMINEIEINRDSKLEDIDRIYEVNSKEMDPLFISLEYFIKDMNSVEIGLVINYFNKLVIAEKPVELLTYRASCLDKYRVVNFLKKFKS